MPFTPYRGSLDPQTLSILQVAFDQAWRELLASSPSMDEQAARDLIAKRIIDAAIQDGERDPERLSQYALAGFAP